MSVRRFVQIIALWSTVQTLLARGAPPPPDIVVDTNVMVPMRDGVKLATDVYRPA